MIILRQKEYSIFDWLFKKNKNKNSSPTNQKEEELPEPTIKLDKITFKELYDNDYWPAVVSMGITCDDDKNDGGWGDMNKWMKEKRFITNGNIQSVHILNDNVKGKNGLTCCVVKFTPGTKIDSGLRLCYASTFKWPEDFIYNCRSWYKSGKNLDEMPDKYKDFFPSK